MKTNICIYFLLIPALAFAEDPVYKAEHMAQCGSWELTLYRSGFAHEQMTNICGESSKSFSRLHRLSAKQFDRLDKVFLQVRFDELPEQIEPATYGFDEDMLEITVYHKGGSKEVDALGLERAANREHASRFSQAWKAINEIVKEP